MRKFHLHLRFVVWFKPNSYYSPRRSPEKIKTMEKTLHVTALSVLIIFVYLHAWTFATDLSLLSGHLQPLGTGRPSHKIRESIGFPDAVTFLSENVLKRIPLKMKGAAKFSSAFTRWTDDYFLSFDLPEDVKVSVETMKKESRQQDVLEMYFQDFVRQYNTSGIYMVNAVPDFISKDVLLPCSIQCKDMMENGLVEAMMWFSSGGTHSVLHTDSVDNINCIYRGDKRFIMIDPDQYGDKVDLDRPEGSYSAVDVDSVDYTKYPGLAEVEFYSVNVTAGDCLYIPYRWIHQVRSYGSNIAVNIWWDHHKMLETNFENCNHPCDLDLTLNNLSFQGFDNVLENVDAIKDHFLSFIGVAKSMNFSRFMKAIGPEEKEQLAKMNAEEQHNSYIKKIFLILDENGDGSVTKEELGLLDNKSWDAVQKTMFEMDKFMDEKLGSSGEDKGADFRQQDEL